MKRRIPLCATLIMLAPVPCASQPSDLCDAAAVAASATTGVPVDMLRAIARVETGRDSGSGLAPWPWTVNRAGKGAWLPTQRDAVAYADAGLQVGEDSMDIGCFQVNFRWHGAAFDSLESMFQPDTNALYAARFLARLRDEKGDWRSAVAAYHSRDPDRGTAYVARVETAFAAMAASAPPDPPPMQPPAERNGFPLLKSGSRGQQGSLVPVSDRDVALIGPSP
jgi:hypothetical protein